MKTLITLIAVLFVGCGESELEAKKRLEAELEEAKKPTVIGLKEKDLAKLETDFISEMMALLNGENFHMDLNHMMKR